MVDKAKLRKAIAEHKSRGGGQGYRFLPKGERINLRVVPFKDDEGSEVLQRAVVFHQSEEFGGKSPVCREQTWGKRCAYCLAKAIAQQSGKTFPFPKWQNRYLVNAVDLNEQKPIMALYQIPASVFDGMANLALSEDWDTVFDVKKGHPIVISRTGSGLDTTYSVAPSRKAMPVPKAMRKDIADPLEKITDPGFKGQCEELGIDPAVFGDDDADEEDVAEKEDTYDGEEELEQWEKDNLETAVDNDEEEEEDDDIPFEEEEEEDDDDDDDDEGEEEVERPSCFEDPEFFDADDDDCKKECSEFAVCQSSINVQKKAAAKKKKKKPAAKKEKPSKKKPAAKKEKTTKKKKSARASKTLKSLMD